jgi:sec-independent protein translocase protein TatA
MFDIGLQEMLLIGVLALLVFGPSRLPELGRMFGRAMREFRRASDEFRSTVETNLHINDPDPVAEAPVPSATPDPLATLPSEAEPAVVETPPADAGGAPAEHGEPFCGQRGARLVHRRECAWVGRIAEVDRVYWKRLTDARDEGLIPCPVCDPVERS